jgi:acetamidase/formamidase
MRVEIFPDDRVHYVWDNEQEPVITVEPGDTVVYHTCEVSDGQIGPDPDASVLDSLDWDHVYPLAGPVAMADAKPGDVLAVEVLDIHTEGWGWTAVIPGFGLLPEDFPAPTSKSSTSPTATTRSSRTTSSSP